MKRTKLFLMIFFLYTNITWSKSKLPILSTKQSVNNLRLFTYDGKVTYYQRRSGSLLMSTNYKVTEVLKSEEGSQYLLKSTPVRKKIIIQVDENFHNFYNMRKPQKIYTVDFQGIEAKELGLGVSPDLHLDDQWVSYYNFSSNKVYIRSLISQALDYTISINNNVNPFFVPKVLMLAPKKVLFTDLNSQGFPGIMLLDKTTGKIKNIFKWESPNSKFEICKLNHNKFAFGIFPLSKKDKNSNSEISLLDIANPDFSKRDIIYNSTSKDIGNISCAYSGDKIYFIQDQSTEDKEITNVAEVTITDKKVTTISDVNDALNIINIDGMILLPNKGKLLIIEGQKNLKDVDIIGN